MNRKDRRAQKAEQRAYLITLDLPEKLTPLPREQWGRFANDPKSPVLAFWSRKYLVQVYDEPSPQYPGMKRLSVSRVNVTTSGRWADGLTWDELQAIKREVGFGDWYGFEIFPPDQKVVNVANIRHLWIFPDSLGIGWE